MAKIEWQGGCKIRYPQEKELRKKNEIKKKLANVKAWGICKMDNSISNQTLLYHISPQNPTHPHLLNSPFLSPDNKVLIYNFQNN